MVMMVICSPEPRNHARHEHTNPASYVDLFSSSYEPSKCKRAESGVKRNIPGRCGNTLAVNGDPGWGDVGRHAGRTHEVSPLNPGGLTG
jgi:hypothetical protein